MSHQQAIEQIQSIRIALDSSQNWCCFRAATIGATGLIGIAAAALQFLAIEDSGQQPIRFVAYWSAVAVLNLVIVATELWIRERHSQSRLLRSKARTIFGQFLPCVLIWMIATLALMIRSVDSVTLLPGLWCLFFSLGVFASLPQLPGSFGWVALWYAVAGSILCINSGWWLIGSGLAMGSCFGAGQLLTAFLIWRDPKHGSR